MSAGGVKELGESLAPNPSPEGRGEKTFSLVVAMDRARGIGKDGKLPWKLSGDMKFFKELTTCPDSTAVEKRWGLRPGESHEVSSWDDVSGMLKFAHKLPEATDTRRNAVVMGRKTWQSLPERFRPLLDRGNFILSQAGFTEPRVGATSWPFFNMALDGARAVLGREIFIIGGAQVFNLALKYPECAHLYLTEIDALFPCDTFFPESPGFQAVLSSPWIEENGVRYRFRRYDRV